MSISTYFRPNIHQNGPEILGIKPQFHFPLQPFITTSSTSHLSCSSELMAINTVLTLFYFILFYRFINQNIILVIIVE
jgi:hypothetical protein